jgi:HepT-like protein
MDAVGLEILQGELAADRRVLMDAAGKACDRVGETHPGHLEACAYELARFYTVFERMLENICAAFENHFGRDGDWHERLLTRLSLGLPGLRPALIPASAIGNLRELNRFRHLIRHAYALTLREDRLRELTQFANEAGNALPAWCAEFVAAVRREQNW